jgi:hypothetical protein
VLSLETSALPVTVDFKLNGLSGPFKVEDLWGARPGMEVRGSLTVKLLKHGAGFYSLKKSFIIK